MADERKRVRNRIDYEGERGRQLGTNLREGALEPNLQMFRDYYQQTTPGQIEDYGKLMSGYNEFAETGGFSPQDKAAIRARAIAPTRSIYAGAKRSLNAQKSRQGGYAPGYNAAESRMNRQLSSQISDANINAEAAIAEMVARNRLAGLSGGSSLYSATPGQAAVFGNQVLNAQGQLADSTANEMRFGLGLIDAERGATDVPGRWDSTLGRINDVSGAIYPWL